ncbi:short-chain dehydrogenase [Loktanella sp. 3ANDIMAR09]|uniref:SDR family oxidoreductase n=1 Tax=Loktanella sp. 3ANDIMAR09 TaxID=1225657 RepID=UPI0006F22065|nr:SDR family oxidoreductase [Loktanella sp. 3ANDIMAR09]KQI68811.1 short-chain dehydrogenase [Loktanella sp. 3ANDIMAR09]
MDPRDKLVVVTGAAAGIGRALCMAFAQAGARLVCVDRDGAGAAATAVLVNGQAATVDVADEAQVAAMIDRIERDTGPIDLFCSNAGIFVSGGVEVPDADWQRIWQVNVMAHVYAARHLVPRMIARGGGYLLNTASAAGLLNQIGAAPYGVTKHAAVGLAEWLALTHGDDGIRVSVLCPQGVDTAMIAGGAGVAGIDGVIPPQAVAEACVQGVRDEVFLILPHRQVRDYIRNKADDTDRWIGGMRKLNRRFRNGQ